MMRPWKVTPEEMKRNWERIKQMTDEEVMAELMDEMPDRSSKQERPTKESVKTEIHAKESQVIFLVCHSDIAFVFSISGTKKEIYNLGGDFGGYSHKDRLKTKSAKSQYGGKTNGVRSKTANSGPSTTAKRSDRGDRQNTCKYDFDEGASRL